MSVLPVITAIGGISAAGRSSCHQGYRRLVESAIAADKRSAMLQSLSALTGTSDEQALLDATLVRRMENGVLDPLAFPVSVAANSDSALSLTVRNMDLPQPLPDGWEVQPLDRSRSIVRMPADQRLLAPAGYESRVQAAGQLPTGFDPGEHYNSRNHPRGLQMTVYAASDALGMMGLDWQTLRQQIPPEQISVYASSAMSQLDDCGTGGMMKSPAIGKRITSKQCPLGLANMPADFINAYLLGSVGRTGGMLGACATFLYNLSLAVADIRSGRARLALVGTAEAPLVAEVIEGYRAMGALAEDEELLKLDPDRDTPDWRRACRPFGFNCGFTMSESAQCVVVMDDALALETGAQILASVPDVMIHADGIKKSISAPGAGNYVTLGRAMALSRQLLGDEALKQRSYVSAHGTSTPQNRITESQVLDKLAGAFGIENWPVAAIKSYLGHSLASAAGDQIMAALGTFAEGWLPGIQTTAAIAPDVLQSHLHFALSHEQTEADIAFINSKGFGGNNATAPLLSPNATHTLLARKHGEKAITEWRHKVETTAMKSAEHDEQCLRGDMPVIYRFGEALLTDDLVSADADSLTLDDLTVTYRDDPGFEAFLAD